MESVSVSDSSTRLPNRFVPRWMMSIRAAAGFDTVEIDDDTMHVANDVGINSRQRIRELEAQFDRLETAAVER